MHILMLASHHGCGDGFTAPLFEQGRVYDAPDALARSFIRRGLAIEPSILSPTSVPKENLCTTSPTAR